MPSCLSPVLFPTSPWHRSVPCTCYSADKQNITLYVKGNYQSPAATATHIHEAAVGRAGPPRLAFPNPVPLDRVSGLDVFSWRASFGCLQGPFRTGLNGTDGGESPFSLFLLFVGCPPAGTAVCMCEREY